ncbi:outer membrane receptor protein [Pasteurellaceae bacterium RH1A]|nr:outer membrane receptor protein [Pasteurellaceae bacterium RH1A]
MRKTPHLSLLSASLLLTFSAYAQDTLVLDTVTVTAEEQVKQSLGVSKISKEDLEKRPVANDVSELVRTMPGVNLTGNSATGQRGNKRQIDLRGMGPENTLILIDGKPVTSRNAERYSMRGERNTRGDSNWVPVEMIESIEVIRGPAAARYGSGAMGGVVNIKTKPATNEFHGHITYYTNQPENSKEGATNRVGFNLSGPMINDVLSFRLYGNYNKTQADALDLNARANNGSNAVAGREGVRNKDINGQIKLKAGENHTWTVDAGFSRQGNIYNGDTQNSNQYNLTDCLVTVGRGQTCPAASQVPNQTTNLANAKAETARLYRQNYALTHQGKYRWGESRTYFMWDKTVNSRYAEGLAGGPEGSPISGADSGIRDSVLKNTRFSTEFYVPFRLGFDQMLTIGLEATRSSLDDPSSLRAELPASLTDEAGIAATNRPTKAVQNTWAVFVEDNIAVTDKFFLTPTVRFDANSKSKSNVSGSLNASYEIQDGLLVRGGLARAYKAPNLYQMNPNYIVGSRGNGCYDGDAQCNVIGNENLKPEISWNKEIGLEYSKDEWSASIAYFHNDYRNKIATGMINYAPSKNPALYRWENAKRALVEGVEGNLTIPLVPEKLRLVNNFTYMIKSINKDTGNPLSVIPRYTWNSSLNWNITESLDANLVYTQYGRQKPSQVPFTNLERGAERDRQGNVTNYTITNMNRTELGSYAVFGLNAGYNWRDTIGVRVGVSNLFNKRVYRESGSAASYNEPGRAYYATVKYSF